MQGVALLVQLDEEKIMAKRRENGQGSVVKLKYKDPVTKEEKESRYYYILYRVGGRRIRESSESEVKAVAEALT